MRHCDSSLRGAGDYRFRCAASMLFVAGLLNTMIWDLYARPEIKSASKGKNRRHRPAGQPGWRMAIR